MNHNVWIPTQILFGSGRINSLGEQCAQFGKKALIVTMHDLVELGILETTIKSLTRSGIEYVICDRISPEPLTKDIDSLRTIIEEANADFVIGFGGGSCLDASKAVAIVATNPGGIWDYIDLRGRPPRALTNMPLPIIAIPTTSGTGAEITMNSVLTNKSTTQKATIKFPSLFPKIAIIDPELTISMPKTITGMTGFDAFSHAMESFINSTNRSPFSDMVPGESMQRLFSYLPKAIKDGKNLEAREQCAWGSVLAGVSIAHAGTTLTHAIAQPATARLGIPHGLAVAIFTFPVLKYTYKHDVERFAMLAKLLVPNEAEALELFDQAELAIKVIHQFLKDCGVDQQLRHYGAKPEIVDELTEDTIGYMGRGLPQHPVNFDKEEIRTIIKEAY